MAAVGPAVLAVSDPLALAAVRGEGEPMSDARDDATGDSPEPFNPASHLRKIGGNADYLEVKWRLVWFRERWPQGSIETDLVHHDERGAIFKATVTMRTDEGKPLGSATGYGSETPGDFRDYLEKAETKAIGRALAAAGFGTQFAPELDGDSGRVVDAPVSRSSRSGSASSGGSGDDESMATPRQRAFLNDMRNQVGMDTDSLVAWCTDHGIDRERLTRKQASQVIEYLKRLAGAGEGGEPR